MNSSWGSFSAASRVIPDLVPVFTGTDPDWIPACAGMTYGGGGNDNYLAARYEGSHFAHLIPFDK